MHVAEAAVHLNKAPHITTRYATQHHAWPGPGPARWRGKTVAAFEVMKK
jgi:hypothetical protein